MLSLTRKYLFDIYKQGDKSHAHKVGQVISSVSQNIKKLDEREKETIRFACKAFRQKLNKPECCRSTSKLEEIYGSWLKGKIIFKPSSPNPPPSVQKKVGRPQKKYNESSGRSQRRMVKCSAQSSASAEVLGLACIKKLKSEGQNDAADLVSQALKNSKDMKENLNCGKQFKKVTNYTPVEALALKISLGLSRDKYNLMRMGMVSKGLPQMYPNKHKIAEEEAKCLPHSTAISATPTGAEVGLQALVDHTAERLVLLISDKIAEQRVGDGLVKLKLTSKWGFDGSSGHSRFKQKEREQTSESAVMTSLVPLELSLVQGDRKVILWLNIAPSSTRFCRPMGFSYEQETDGFIVSHHRKTEATIKALHDTEVGSVYISHELVPSMFDGKICSALAGQAKSNCHVCGARPTQMNELQELKKLNINVETYKFGLSPLHARIRFLEFVLHLGYKLINKTWAACTDAQKRSVEDRKTMIQDTYRRETGLLLDSVKQGFGNTNDGNTARRFFEDVERASRVTGVNKELLERLSLILRVLSCGRTIDVTLFRKFCLQTARLHVKLYRWFYMPQAVHKILIHGADIIQASELSPKQLSEEAQESRNKDLRNFRENFTRKSDKVSTNLDLLRKLLVTSDPVISSKRVPKTQHYPISEKMKALLVADQDTEDEDEDS